MKILTFIFLVAMVAQLTQSLNDDVQCFRMKDSSFGHFISCTAQKPLPLKVQTTFTLDKDFAWNIFSYDVALYDGVTKKTTSLANCIQGILYGNQFIGRPGPGNKTAGSNLTLATVCNSLPRELKQYDIIRYQVHFPGTQWLVWAVPIPGYSTNQDVQRIMSQDIKLIQGLDNEVTNKKQQSLLSKIMLKHLRKSKP